MPLQPLQNARKDEGDGISGADSTGGHSVLPVNIANGSINLNVTKILPGPASKITSMSPSLSLPKITNIGKSTSATTTVTTTATATTSAAAAVGPSSASNSAAFPYGTTSSTSTTSTLTGAGGKLSSHNSDSNGSTMNEVGKAAGDMLSGMFGMVKDAASVVDPTQIAGSGKSKSAFKPRSGMPSVLPGSNKQSNSEKVK